MNWRLHAAVVRIAFVGLLSGCTSYNVVSPQDKMAVRNGSAVQVDATATPRFVNFSITVDSQPAGSVPCQSDGECAGPLAISAGNHSVMFSADIPCWYCGSDYKPSVTRSICMGHSPATYATAAVVASAKTDGQVWNNVSDSGTGTVAAGGASNDTKWRTYNLSGGLQSLGLIQSVANDCLCMQSRNDPSNHGIQLAWCDFSKGTQTQIWESWPPGNGDPGAHRYKNFGSQNCITEGASGSLEDRTCDLSNGATPNSSQIWTLKDGSGTVVQPF
jgi:hypothetical protein